MIVWLHDWLIRYKSTYKDSKLVSWANTSSERFPIWLFVRLLRWQGLQLEISFWWQQILNKTAMLQTVGIMDPIWIHTYMEKSFLIKH